MEQEVKPAPEPKWLSVAAVARSFGVSEMTLYRVIAAGKFPAVRISQNRIVVPASVLDELARRAIETWRLVDAAEWAQGVSG